MNAAIHSIPPQLLSAVAQHGIMWSCSSSPRFKACFNEFIYDRLTTACTVDVLLSVTIKNWRAKMFILFRLVCLFMIIHSCIAKGAHIRRRSLNIRSGHHLEIVVVVIVVLRTSVLVEPRSTTCLNSKIIITVNVEQDRA